MDSVELVRRDLVAEPASVRTARHLVLDAVEGWADDDVVDAALVITSELATNATLHAVTGFTVVVLRLGACLRIEVHDGSQRMPRRKHYSDQSATGRGLPLVEALSTLSGAERTDAGKVVWAEVGQAPSDRPRPSDAVSDLRVMAPDVQPTSADTATAGGTTAAPTSSSAGGSALRQSSPWRARSSAWPVPPEGHRTCRTSRAAWREQPVAGPCGSRARPARPRHGGAPSPDPQSQVVS